ncbi:UNVERIFIED_CONTAM: RNA polymerase sigma factor [Acetivibrio alkalicellulosi]
MLDVRRIIHFKRKNNNGNESNEAFFSMLKEIKEGNLHLRDDFISQYTPFIIRVTSKAMGKYIDTRNNDEFSIAMSAFNEAINSYDLTKNYNFFLFSEQVIKRRLIDFLRRNKHSNEYPFSYFNENQEFSEKYLSLDTDFSFEDVESREEINKYKMSLEEFGISFMDLALSVPKHQDSRKMCMSIAKVLADDDTLFEILLKNKSLPRKELKKKVKVHSRTLGNNRRYIIALCLILRSNLDLSKRYIKYAMEGGR